MKTEKILVDSLRSAHEVRNNPYVRYDLKMSVNDKLIVDNTATLLPFVFVSKYYV